MKTAFPECALPQKNTCRGEDNNKPPPKTEGLDERASGIRCGLNERTRPWGDMPDSSRLIVVSNRLPVEVVRKDDKWKTKRTAGGLATAMDPILKRAGGLWIGWSGAEEELPAEALELLRQEQSCIAVELPADLQKKFYDGC